MNIKIYYFIRIIEDIIEYIYKNLDYIVFYL